MSSKNFFWAKPFVALFLSLENCKNYAKKAIKAHEIDVKKTRGYTITKSSKSDTCDWTPTWSRADYVTNRRTENQSRSRILL